VNLSRHVLKKFQKIWDTELTTENIIIPKPLSSTQIEKIEQYCLDLVSINIVDNRIELYGEVKNIKDAIQNIIKIVASTTDYPTTWGDQLQNCVLITIKKLSDEWKEVVEKVNNEKFDSNIECIQRIQNKWLWDKYVHEREIITKKKWKCQ